MIKSVMFLAVAVFSIVIYTGCKKSTSSSPNCSMTATITQAGVITQFSTTGASNVFAVDSSDSVNSANKTLIISGSMLTTGSVLVSTIYLNIAGYNGVGTYSVLPSPENDGYYTYNNAYTQNIASQTSVAYGQVVISSVSGQTLTGSFSCTLVDSSTIANGKFVADAQNLKAP